MHFNGFIRFIKLDKTLLEQKNEIKKEKIMPRKPEPKIKFIYNSEPIMPESLRKEKYERFLMCLVEIFKANQNAPKK